MENNGLNFSFFAREHKCSINMFQIEKNDMTSGIEWIENLLLNTYDK